MANNVAPPAGPLQLDTELEQVLQERLLPEGMSDPWPLGLASYLPYRAWPELVVELDDRLIQAIGLTSRDEAEALLVSG
jgi:hypothetical protein